MRAYTFIHPLAEGLGLFAVGKLIDEATKARLEKLICLRMKINHLKGKIASSAQEEDAISKDQARLPENIEALTKTPEARQLIARYIAKANEQETRIEQIAKDKVSLTTDAALLEPAVAIQDFELK